ncbi:MAG: diaminohydroxyphosphoribosylaminopyrimidine deaminase, partial [Leptolyngbya sp. SIO1D8]|nr:diaminohydroxyphosphoribosylaminopyrimidine deaminase [Leptolyngbya sp. SIO1D8]
MPKLGLSMTEGSVAAWYVSPGSSIASGDVVADIETSKITNELEVFASGTFRRAVVALGVEVPVGALIGVIADASVAESEIDSFVAAYAPGGDAAVGDTPVQPAESSADDVSATSGTVAGSQAGQGASVPEELSGSYDEAAVFASHHAHKLAGSLGIDLRKVIGTGRAGRISRNDVTAAFTAAGGRLAASVSEASSAPAPSRNTIKTTPVARRLADEHGIDLADVAATGSRGRISKGDVLAYIEKRNVSAAVAPAPAGTLADNAFVEEALSSTRKVIARRLADSKTTAPHYRLSVDVIIDKLLELRSDINGSETQTRVSVNDMLIRAAALALLEDPAVNVQFDGET